MFHLFVKYASLVRCESDHVSQAQDFSKLSSGSSTNIDNMGSQLLLITFFTDY